MKDKLSSIAEFSEAQRRQALERYNAIRPVLEERETTEIAAKKYGIAERTLFRWVQSYRESGLAGLVRRTRSDTKVRRIPVDLQHLIEGLALSVPPLSTSEIHRRTTVAAEKRNVRPPSYSAVYSIVHKMDPALRVLAHRGTAHYSNQYDLLYRNETKRPNAVWQADHTPLDVVINDKGKPKKPWLTIILDDYSRAIVGYSLSLSAPSAAQTSLALRHAIWRKPQPDWVVCGIPDVLYTDNGSDFTSSHLEQVAADLRIQLIRSVPGKPRGRGKVERFFRSLNQVLLPGIPGHQPPGQGKATPVLSLTQLSKEVENYLVRSYNVTPHSSTNQPPQERWSSGGFLPRMPDSLAQLDLLLLTVPLLRKVRADGIYFMNLRYIAPTLAAYVGENVLVRYDPRDMAEIRVFHNDVFVCKAICQELAGETVPLKDIVGARRLRQRELRQTIKDRTKMVESLLESRRWVPATEEVMPPEDLPPKPSTKLKRYRTDS